MNPKTYRHKIIHGLSLDEAQTAAFNAITKYSSQYANIVTIDWEDSCRASISIRFPPNELKGMVTINEDAIRLSIQDVPFGLRPFAPRALNAIEKEAWERINLIKANR